MSRSVIVESPRPTVDSLVKSQEASPSRCLKAFSAPVFLLAPPRSFTSVIGSMVGQHPELFAIPETHLFGCETLAEWWQRCAEAAWPMNHGLLRTIAELYFGGQSEPAVRLASSWLRRRLHLSIGALMELLVQRISPLLLVEKSPSIVWNVRWLQQVIELFPQARFVHLVRHPRAHADSLLKYLNERADVRSEQPPRPHWEVLLGSFPPAAGEPGDDVEPPVPEGSLDPQWGWYRLNRNIMDFLGGVPADQVFRLRGEDVLTDPDRALKPLCAWLGIREDEQALEEMKHPERSPFACIGPANARFGMDAFFLESPSLRPSRAEPRTLEGPLPWRPDGRGFAPVVRQLALEFGYT